MSFTPLGTGTWPGEAVNVNTSDSRSHPRAGQMMTSLQWAKTAPLSNGSVRWPLPAIKAAPSVTSSLEIPMFWS
jgi:hypothetical protein